MKALLRFLLRLIPSRFLFSESNEDVSSCKIDSEESALSIYVDDIIQEVHTELFEEDKEDFVIDKYIAQILHKVLEEEQIREDCDITEYVDTILKAVGRELLAEREYTQDLSDPAVCDTQESQEQDEDTTVHWYIETILTALQQDLCAEELSYKELETESITNSVEECDDQEDLESILEEVQNEFVDGSPDSDSADIEIDLDFIMPRRGMPPVNPCSSKPLVRKRSVQDTVHSDNSQIVKKSKPKEKPAKTNKGSKEGKMLNSSQRKNTTKSPTNVRMWKNGTKEDSFFASCGNFKAENSVVPPNDAGKPEKRHDWSSESGQQRCDLGNEGEAIQESWAIRGQAECNVSMSSDTPPTDNALMKTNEEKPVRIAANEDNNGFSETTEKTLENSYPQQKRPSYTLEETVKDNDINSPGGTKNKGTKRNDTIKGQHHVITSGTTEGIIRKTKSGKITSLQEPKIVVRPTRGSHAARCLVPAADNAADKQTPLSSRVSSSHPLTVDETDKLPPCEAKFKTKKKPPKARVTIIQAPRKPIWERYKKHQANVGERRSVDTPSMKKVTRVRKRMTLSAPITSPSENGLEASVRKSKDTKMFSSTSCTEDNYKTFVTRSETEDLRMLPSKNNTEKNLETCVTRSETEDLKMFPSNSNTEKNLEASVTMSSIEDPDMFPSKINTEKNPDATLIMSETEGSKTFPSNCSTQNNSQTTMTISGPETSATFPTKINTETGVAEESGGSSRNSQQQVNLLDLPISSNIPGTESGLLEGDETTMIASNKTKCCTDLPTENAEYHPLITPTQLSLSEKNVELLIDFGEPESSDEPVMGTLTKNNLFQINQASMPDSRDWFSAVGSDSLETLVDGNCSEGVDQRISSGNPPQLENMKNVLISFDKSLTDLNQTLAVHPKKQTNGASLYTSMSKKGMLKPLKVQTEDNDKCGSEQTHPTKEIPEKDQCDVPCLTNINSANKELGNDTSSQDSLDFDLEHGKLHSHANEESEDNQILDIQWKSGPVKHKHLTVPPPTTNVCIESSHHDVESNDFQQFAEQRGLNSFMFAQLAQFGQNSPALQTAVVKAIPLAPASDPTEFGMDTGKPNFLKVMKTSGEKPRGGDRDGHCRTLESGSDANDSVQQMVVDGSPRKVQGKADRKSNDYCNEQRTDRVDNNEVSRSSHTFKGKRKSFIPVSVSRLASKRKNQESTDNSRSSVVETQSYKMSDHVSKSASESCRQMFKDKDGERKTPVNSKSEGDESNDKKTAQGKRTSVCVRPSTNKSFRLRTESLKKAVEKSTSRQKGARVTLKRSKTARSPRSKDISGQNVHNAKTDLVLKKGKPPYDKEDARKRSAKKRPSSDTDAKVCPKENQRMNFEEEVTRNELLESFIVDPEIPPNLKPSPEMVKADVTTACQDPWSFAMEDFCPSVELSKSDYMGNETIQPEMLPEENVDSECLKSPESKDVSEQSINNTMKGRVSRKDTSSDEKEDAGNELSIRKRPAKKRPSSDKIAEVCPGEIHRMNFEEEVTRNELLESFIVDPEIPPNLKPSPERVNVLSERNCFINEVDPQTTDKNDDKHQKGDAYQDPWSFVIEDFCPSVEWSKSDDMGDETIQLEMAPEENVERESSECFTAQEANEKHQTEKGKEESSSLQNKCKPESVTGERESVFKETGKKIIETYLQKQVEIRKLSTKARHREVVRCACDLNQQLPARPAHYSSDIQLLSVEFTDDRNKEKIGGGFSTQYPPLRGDWRFIGDAVGKEKQSKTAKCTPLLILLLKAHTQQLSQSYPELFLCLENYRNYYPLQRKILLSNPFSIISSKYRRKFNLRSQSQLTKPILLKALSSPMRRVVIELTEIKEDINQTERNETENENISPENRAKHQFYPFDAEKLGIVLKWLIQKFHETTEYMHMLERQQNDKRMASHKSEDYCNANEPIVEMSGDDETNWYSVVRSSSEHGLIEDGCRTDPEMLLLSCDSTQNQDPSTTGRDSEENDVFIPIFSHIEDETSYSIHLENFPKADTLETASWIGRLQEDLHTNRFVLYSSVVMLKEESPNPHQKTLKTRAATPARQISIERGPNSVADKAPRKTILDTLRLRARRIRNVRRFPAFGNARHFVRKQVGRLFGCMSRRKHRTRG